MARIFKPALAVVAASAVFVAGGASTAVAAKLITGDDIANNTITGANIKKNSVQDNDIAKNSIGRSELKPGIVKDGKQGPAGPAGQDGTDGLLGAFYSVAYYDVGNTNKGAIASVACDPTETAFTAIAGGVQTLGLDDSPLDNNTPVSSSFPGRMDYSTNTPKPDRLDGWIIQFGGATDNPDPLRVKVWALCVPNTDIPVTQTYLQSE